MAEFADRDPALRIVLGEYVFPLRSEGAIWFKQGIDPRFERMAITSYSAFTALARARIKIFEDYEDYSHVEELYMHIQRASLE